MIASTLKKIKAASEGRKQGAGTILGLGIQEKSLQEDI